MNNRPNHVIQRRFDLHGKSLWSIDGKKVEIKLHFSILPCLHITVYYFRCLPVHYKRFDRIHFFFKASEKDVKELAARLKIQVDNLCQFLPQVRNLNAFRHINLQVWYYVSPPGLRICIDLMRIPWSGIFLIADFDDLKLKKKNTVGNLILLLLIPRPP